MIELFKFIASDPVNVFLFIVAILIFSGGFLFLDGTVRRNLKREINPMGRMLRQIDRGLKEGGVAKYDAVRNILLWSVLFIGALATLKDIVKGLVVMLLGLIFYILFQPVEIMYGKKSPYIWLMETFEKTQRDNYRDELYDATIQLKNLIASNKGKSITSNYVLKQLMKYTEQTKPVFARLISMNMKDEQEAAREMFEEAFHDKLAGDFVYIVQRMDTTTPEEFLPLLDTLILNFNERQKTRQVREQSHKETTLFTLASAQIMILIINFVLLVFITTLAQIAAL